MRIPLSLREVKTKSGDEVIMTELTGVLLCRRPTLKRRSITFMIDTGATMPLILTEQDAELLGVPFSSSHVRRVEADKAPTAWSGTLETYEISRVVLLTKTLDDDGKPRLGRFELPKVHIVKNTPPGLPSAIGVGFLLLFQLRFVFSPIEGKAFFEGISSQGNNPSR